MIKLQRIAPTFPNLYLADSRFFTHALFWVGYYLLFSLIWMKPEQGFFASFYLEFVLMPVRILAAYTMIYLLIPKYLEAAQYRQFIQGYVLLLVGAGAIQTVFSHFFYQQLYLGGGEFVFGLSAWVRNAVLINTTVLLLGSLKVFQLYLQVKEQGRKDPDVQGDTAANFIEVKSERRYHRLLVSDILLVKGMGNYVTYFLANGDKKIVYSSVKEALNLLPEQFLRVHRSYIINRDKIESYNKESIFIGDHEIPRGHEVADEELALKAA